MTKVLKVKRLRGASIFKLILTGNTIGLGLLCAIFSLPASFGVEILKWNGQYVTGPVALLAGPMIGVLLGLLFGLFAATFAYVGLRIYSRFRYLELEYIPTDEQ